MKRAILTGIMMMGIAGLSAGELTVGLDQLTSSNDVFTAMLKELPVKTFYDYRKNMDGSEILRIGAFRPMFSGFYIDSEPYSRGNFKVRITGRRSSKEVNCWCQVECLLSHSKTDACDQFMVAESAQRQVKLPVAPADAEPIEVEMDLSGSRLCPGCGKRFSAARLVVGINVNLAASDIDTKLRYYEISDICLSAPFPLKIGEKLEDMLPTNAELLKNYYAVRQNWETKHRQILASYPKSNRFDAADLRKLPAAATADENYRYFSLAELQELNPDFEIKKMVSWSFYNPEVFADLSYFLNHSERVSSAFRVDNLIYATDNESFLMRYDAAKNVWDYIYDATPQEAKHPRPKSFLGDFKKVYYADGKIRKLFDFNVVNPPDGIFDGGMLVPGKYAVTGDGKVYWLGDGGRVYAGNPDFSKPTELSFALPAALAGSTLTAVDQIYGDPDNRRLLLDCRIRVGDKAAYALLELDPAAKTAIAKTAPASCGVAWERVAGAWLFAADGKYWLNPGGGMVLRPWDLPSGMAADGNWRTFLTKSLRWGNFVCGPTAAQDRFLCYNMDNPAASLMLYGFNARECQVAADGSGLLFTMPDGWYQVCRKPDAPAAPQAKAASPPSPPLKLMRAVGGIEAADSDFMSFRWEKQNGDGVLILNAKGSGENSKLTLELELPLDEAQYVIEFSDNPQLNFKKGLSATAEERNRNECTVDMIDRHTLLVSGKAAYLYLDVNTRQLPQEIVLKIIYKK